MIFDTIFLLVLKRNVFKRHARHGETCENTDVKTADFHILDVQRTDVVCIIHVDTGYAFAVIGNDFHIGNVSLVACVKTNADETRIALTRVQGDVADGVSFM